MRRNNITYKKLLEEAESYGVSDNAFFLAQLDAYVIELETIRRISKESKSNSSLTTEKTYLKGQQNTYADPLIKELPKHIDILNKTSAEIRNIIMQFGHKPEAKKESKLDELMNE